MCRFLLTKNIIYALMVTGSYQLPLRRKDVSKFSEFLNDKCKKNDKSIRKIAIKAEITHTYLLQLMNSKKEPPEAKTQERIVKALDLEKDDAIKFYNLAAEQRGDLPADIYIKILNNKKIYKEIRER